jgi:hypothetical protein
LGSRRAALLQIDTALATFVNLAVAVIIYSVADLGDTGIDVRIIVIAVVTGGYPIVVGVCVRHAATAEARLGLARISRTEVEAVGYTVAV